MSDNLDHRSHQKIDGDLQLMMTCFQEVLVSLGETRLAKCLPWSSSDEGSAELSREEEGRYVQALSISFQLLNMVEENAAVVEILEQSGWFELLKVYSGLEQRAYREHLLRLRPSPQPKESSPDGPPRPTLPTEVALRSGVSAGDD